MSKKVLFNPDFDFDFNELEKNDINDTLPLPKTKTEPERVELDLSAPEANKFNDFGDDDKFELLKAQKDYVRTKTSSAKKRAIQDDFFEVLTKKSCKEFNNFEEMKISKPLIKALNKLEFTQPTTIQSSAIPIALLGKDICACAVTGSGKTVAFMLPTLERLLYKPKFPQVTRVLVLTPTRELAEQICKVTRLLAQFTSINTCLCAGGFDIKAQEASLRLGPDICVATPGRLIDHLHNTPCFNLETVEILILDEADRMLDESFSEQLKEVIRLCSKTHQTMLFSATMTDKIEDLLRMSLRKPVKIFISENVDVTPLLKQEFVRLRDSSEKNREALLLALIQRKFHERVIVFVRTKIDCHRLCILLNCLNLKAAELHGSLSQTQRIEKLNSFKDGLIDILVATDLAARGLDIDNVKTVINFSMPMTYKHYIHRVGRTARAQNSGRSISLVCEDDRWLLKEIIKSSKEPVKCRVVPADVIEFYRDKCDQCREKVAEVLSEERLEQQMQSLDKDISKAKNRLEKSGQKVSGNKRVKEADLLPKRTWLENVDYKTGALKDAKKKNGGGEKKKSGKNKKINKDDDSENDDHNDENDRLSKRRFINQNGNRNKKSN